MQILNPITKVVEWIDEATINRSRDDGPEVGFTWTLYDLDLRLLTILTPILSSEFARASHGDVKSLEQSLSNLRSWGEGFHGRRLDKIVQESDDIEKTLRSSLVGIGRLLINSKRNLMVP
jgi:hypothetical protein